MVLSRRVQVAPTGEEGWATAKEVSGVIGGRPREAGNELRQRVAGGLVERRAGDGMPQQLPASYGMSAQSSVPRG